MASSLLVSLYVVSRCLLPVEIYIYKNYQFDLIYNYYIQNQLNLVNHFFKHKKQISADCALLHMILQQQFIGFCYNKDIGVITVRDG